MGKIRDNLRRNLGYYLTLEGLSQKELADKLNVSPAAVSNWIKGNNSPDIEAVAGICDVLQISVTDLFGTDDTELFSSLEKEIIYRYRKKPELQKAIRIILDLESNGS